MLVENWYYKPAQVDRTAEKISVMDQSLQTSFQGFLDSEVFSDFPSYFGLTPKIIAENYPFKPPAVFLCLDWIRRDPQNALDALVEEYKKPLPDAFDAEQLKEYLFKNRDK